MHASEGAPLIVGSALQRAQGRWEVLSARRDRAMSTSARRGSVTGDRSNVEQATRGIGNTAGATTDERVSTPGCYWIAVSINTMARTSRSHPRGGSGLGSGGLGA